MNFKTNKVMEKDIYQMVTDQIISEIKKGIIPWQKPWIGASGAVNYVTRIPYTLMNQMLLGEPGEYITFKQCKALGGSIKKGAESKMVIFYKQVAISHPEEKTETRDEGDIEVVTEIKPLIKYYRVFNIKDCEGIEPKMGEGAGYHHDPIQEAEEIVNNYHSRETHLRIERETPSDKAFFSLTEDLVKVPCLSQYKDVNEYYSTLFHELTHSTGIESRCKRGIEKDGCFGSVSYSKEELVAEIGAAMLVNKCGLNAQRAFKNSVAYLQGWLKVLKNDNKLITRAATKATQAVKYILNEQYT